MADLRESQFADLVLRRFAGIDGLLIYGNDEESISDVLRQLQANWKSEGDVIELEAATLRGGAGELSDHLQSRPLFGGRTLVVLKGTEEAHATVMEPLVGAGAANFLVVVSGSLKKNSALRALFATSPRFHALALFEEGDASALQRVRMLAQEQALRLEPGAAERLFELCGASRALLAAEIEKLVLLKPEDNVVSVDLVERSCGDQAAADVDRLLEAVLNGEAATSETTLRQCLESGEMGAVLPLLLLRLSRLTSVKAALEDGVDWEQAFARANPPVFFKQQPAMRRQLSRFSLESLLRLQEQVQSCVLESRKLGPLSASVVSRFALSLSVRRPAA
jgi:DNA polymerase-3 subunit delta